MADYSKKVIYLSYLEQGNKIKGAGFIKTEIIGNQWAFDMHVSGMAQLAEKKYDIYVVDWKEREYRVGSIFLHRGGGEWKKSGEGNLPGTDGLSFREIGRFVIKLSDMETIEGKYQTLPVTEADSGKRQEEKKELRAAEKTYQEKSAKAEEVSLEPKKRANREMLGGSRKKEIKMEEIILNDKWEQLCQMYPVVHPYEDERKYISIQPKDFVVMTGDYQHLANNSFLLHGFYNYRHIVLGREPFEEARDETVKERDGAGRQGGEHAYGDFFLGVPGVYYEREKMVALMFGFEAFECSGGKAEPGKFGYYLRRVKI